MRPFNRHELANLLARHDAPCVTLAMPTSRRLPGSQQHATLYGNLVRQASAALEKKHGRGEARVAKVLETLEMLGGDAAHPEGLRAFWNHQKDGLAVFCSPDTFAFYRVPLKLREICVVADTFHVKPLLPLLFDDIRYHVLTLTRNEVMLHEGNGDHLETVPHSGVPRSIDEALGADVVVARPDRAAHGGTGGPGQGKAFHGYGKGSDDDKEELRRFFRAIDKVIAERHSKPTGLPLILAAVDYYHPLYREISHDRCLLPHGVTSDPVGLSQEKLHQEAWRIFGPVREARRAEAIEEFGTARAWNRGSSELEDVARAAVSGRVKTLLVEEKRRIWGRLDRASGELALGGSPGEPDDTDVLDQLAEETLRHGGAVLLVPHERMPGAHGAAATFRF